MIQVQQSPWPPSRVGYNAVHAGPLQLSCRPRPTVRTSLHRVTGVKPCQFLLQSRHATPHAVDRTVQVCPRTVPKVIPGRSHKFKCRPALPHSGLTEYPLKATFWIRSKKIVNFEAKTARPHQVVRPNRLRRARPNLWALRHALP
jgi:hypothetical protein